MTSEDFDTEIYFNMNSNVASTVKDSENQESGSIIPMTAKDYTDFITVGNIYPSTSTQLPQSPKTTTSSSRNSSPIIEVEPKRKYFKPNQNYEATPIFRCNATLGNKSASEDKENEGQSTSTKDTLFKTCNRLEKSNQLLLSKMNHIKTILDRHTVLLEKISSKIYLEKRTFDIFPIKSLEDLKKIDDNIQNIPKEDLISYMKEIVGKATPSKCFNQIFADETVLKINWDGAKEKFPLKSVKLFSTYFFDAVKSENFGYVQYERDMKEGFRLAKNRIYKNTFKLKNKTL